MTTALLDSNVLIAGIVREHPHHPASGPLVAKGGFAIAAHSLSEVYNNLTREGATGHYRRAPSDASRALDHLAAAHLVLSITSAQHLDGIRAYAATGGVGPRVYDHLIGHIAALHGIGAIITWNTKHMRPLFPRMRVATPAEWASAEA